MINAWYLIIGAVLGVLIRAGLVSWLPSEGSISLGILSANLLACFIAGIVFSLDISMTLKVAILTGLCGSMSTFSTLIVDSYQQMIEAYYLKACTLWVSHIAGGGLSYLLGRELTFKLTQ